MALAANEASSRSTSASHARGRVGWAAGMDADIGEGALMEWGC
jgi:hypothetical protein